MMMPNVELAWRRVEARDASADGAFVYAVRTTGIFCRPSCPSRRPARENAVFFETPAEAAAAGFRGCLRCRPDGPSPHAQRLAEICRYLDQDHQAVPTLATIAARCGMSASAARRLFQRSLGLSPREYLAARRRQRLSERLGASRSVTEAIYDAGYGSASRVYESDELGMTPREYREGGPQQRIRFAVSASLLGKMLVAVTDRGLCAISFGDDEGALVDELAKQFSQAAILRSDETLAGQVGRVLAAITEDSVSTALPLDVRATAFQRRVWNALRRIPRGETRTYSEIAASAGNPNAVRAVARACSRNPVAVVIPCHRVIGKNGTLTGYRWGIERKAKLLELERRAGLPVER